MTPRRSLIFDTVLDPIFRTALVFSLFLLFTGHNAPGGGFVGGLVAGTSFTLRYVAGGATELNRLAPVGSAQVLGSGLLLAAVTGMGGWIWGDAFLESTKVDAYLPVIGEIHATSALPFDIGVYLVVVGLALAVLRSLGAAADEQEDA